MPEHCRATHDLYAHMEAQDRAEEEREHWQQCFQCEEQTEPGELVEFLTLADGVHPVCTGCIRTAMSGDNRDWKAFLAGMTAEILGIQRQDAIQANEAGMRAVRVALGRVA